ncbi:MAG: 2-C-methyl-D-erythritol 4-phosphate cytidylyltransferase [Acidobacteriota bacterium]|nr:2-C-methyl-D-erythritol 4-phosphate cytidylyltransferase [Acidobacteriota bacterium]
MARVGAVIVAAGEGRRFGGPKQFAPLRGRPVLDWSLAAFEANPRVDAIVLVMGEAARGAEAAARYPKIAAVVRGGERRQDSVANGVAALKPAPDDIVLIHDGARPLVTQDLIDRVLEAAVTAGAAVPGLPLEDTIKEIAAGRVVRTIDRDRLARIQTPQGFTAEILRRALEAAREAGISGTDEAALVERLGLRVAVVPGDPRNIKITSPLDLMMAEAGLGR